VKFNGMPYVSPLNESDEWPFYGSTSGLSMRLLLELIWTRISYRLSLGSGMFGDDLITECFSILLAAKPLDRGDIRGWQYRYVDWTQEELNSKRLEVPWEPVTLTEEQFVCIGILSKAESIDINDSEFLGFLAGNGLERRIFLKEFVSTGLVYVDDEDRLRLLTEQCVAAVMPDGAFVAGENRSGRFERWIAQHVGSKAVVRPDSEL
jgi:hypothetical protein